MLVKNLSSILSKFHEAYKIEVRTEIDKFLVICFIDLSYEPLINRNQAKDSWDNIDCMDLLNWIIFITIQG